MTREDDPARGYIVSSIFFVSGLVTLLQVTLGCTVLCFTAPYCTVLYCTVLQVTLGCRLPIIQGGTFSFLVPTIAILSLPHNKVTC